MLVDNVSKTVQKRMRRKIKGRSSTRRKKRRRRWRKMRMRE